MGPTPAQQPPELDYFADDRSLLLRPYQRWLIAPVLAWLPARLSPNAITHVGHLLNLAALLLLVLLWPERGWPLYVAAVLVQLYIWCDNADGAHARRTGRSSAYGELLDHGLDILNVVYIACISAFALGLSPMLWVLVVLLITVAPAFSYWEQTETGVLRLGMLNQVESGLVVSGALCVSAVLGRGWWAHVAVHDIHPQLVMVLWPSVTILFGIARGAVRVTRQRGLRALAPVIALVLFDSGIVLAAALGTLSARVAVVLAVAGNVFFATRMLTMRVAGPVRGTKRALSFGIVGIAALLAIKLGLPADAIHSAAAPHLDTALAALAALVFGVAVLRDARRGIAEVR
ncbi:MAG: CDP-alcohol phosphatidyltransferase family protein [Deltaproteobacteria bacterium]|nr:CDP-alcohol phosphatidyltransferase family protein [Deltaproteobacteria bacterium]